MTDDDKKKWGRRTIDLVKKMVETSEPNIQVDVAEFDPKDPTTIRMKVSFPLPYIELNLSIEDPKADALRLRAEIAAARMLEAGEWRPFSAAALLLTEITNQFGFPSITALPDHPYKESLEISSDPVKWAKRMIELDVPDPAAAYLSRRP